MHKYVCSTYAHMYVHRYIFKGKAWKNYLWPNDAALHLIFMIIFTIFLLFLLVFCHVKNTNLQNWENKFIVIESPVDFQYWISQGADRKKIVMGMPLYGQSFTLANANEHDLNAPTIGGGTAGEFTRAAGFLSYYEARHSEIICLLYWLVKLA